MARVRKRSNTFPKGEGKAYLNGNLISTTDYFSTPESSFKETTTESPYPTGWNAQQRLLRDPDTPDHLKEKLRAHDYGCNFTSEKTTVTTPNVNLTNFASASIKYTYRGPVFADSRYRDFLSPVSLANDLTDAFGEGARSIKNTAPTSPQASLAVMVGELREGLPKVMGLKLLQGGPKELIRGSADEFLNYQFGWLPLVNDLQKLSESVINSKKILQQLYRDSGKTVRRRLPDKISTVTTQEVRTGRTTLPGLITYHYADLRVSGRLSVDTTTTVARSFAAQYAYTIAQDDSLFERLERYDSLARKVLGLSISLETAWDLSPYSWLVDWLIDIGTVLSNITLLSRDQFVIEHGYQMLHRSNDVTLKTLDVFLKGYGPIETQMHFDRKIRLKASPYGFDVDQDGLSAIQMSILGALGITRWPKDFSWNILKSIHR